MMPADHPQVDVQVGGDIYNDNLFDKEVSFPTYAIWSRASLLKTNFSLSDYHAFLWTGNAKMGAKYIKGTSMHFLYGLADWTMVSKYGNRWWEQFIRGGVGYRLYPFYQKDKNESHPNDFLGSFLSRFHIYVEGLTTVAWIGENPNKMTQLVPPYDLRVGVGYSTGGFFRLKQ